MMFPHDSALDASPGPILRQLLPDFHDQERKRLSRESSFDVGNYIPSRTPSAIGNVESEKTSSPVQDEMPSRATVESSSQRYSLDALSRASPSSEVKEVKNEVRSTGKTLDTIGSLSPLSSYVLFLLHFFVFQCSFFFVFLLSIGPSNRSRLC